MIVSTNAGALPHLPDISPCPVLIIHAAT